MGSSTESDVVENIIWLEAGNKVPGLREGTDGDDPTQPPLKCGWKFGRGAVKQGKKKRLYASELKKGALTIYVVNISLYAAGGDVDLVAFGPLPAMQAFIKDAKLGRIKIMAEDSICQTL